MCGSSDFDMKSLSFEVVELDEVSYIKSILCKIRASIPCLGPQTRNCLLRVLFPGYL